MKAGSSGEMERPECVPVYRLRDFSMTPKRGIYTGVHWTQYASTLRLHIPLRGAEWSGVREDTFLVKVNTREIVAGCRNFYVMNELHLRFEHDVVPECCWLSLERAWDNDGGRSKVLLVEVAKAEPWKHWSRKALGPPQTARSQEQLRLLLDMSQPGWTLLRPRHWTDAEEPCLASREAICRELEIGQTEDSYQVRVILDPKGWDEVLERAVAQEPGGKKSAEDGGPWPAVACRLWGLDVSKRHMALFLRGDRSRPVLCGRLAGNCMPDRCSLELTDSDTEIAGNFEHDVPCLHLVIVKEADSIYDWGPIDFTDPAEVLNEGAAAAAARAAPGPSTRDLAGQSAGEWAADLRERAAAEFKAENFDLAIEYYTRLLQCMPGSEKLLSNRSVAYLKAGRFHLALADAVKAQEINPYFAKVYFRKGQALQRLHRLGEAIAAFKEGKTIDSENAEWNREIFKVGHEAKQNKDRTWI